MTTTFKIEAYYNKGENVSTAEAVSTKEQRKLEPVSTQTNEEITSTDVSKKFSKAISTIAVVYASSQMVVNPILQENINNASISGNYVQAEAIRRKQQTVNQFINLGLEGATLGVLALTMSPLAIAGGVGLGLKYGQQAIKREQANRAMQAVNNIDNYINSYESSRLINVKAGR